MEAILVGRRVIGYNSERGPPNNHSIKVWSQLAKQFQRWLLSIFPIGSNVKTMSADTVDPEEKIFEFLHRVQC